MFVCVPRYHSLNNLSTLLKILLLLKLFNDCKYLKYLNFSILVSPHCSIYFTTNGEKPNPFARRFSGREITFKYRAPFALKAGKRMVKAVAVAQYVDFIEIFILK